MQARLDIDLDGFVLSWKSTRIRPRAVRRGADRARRERDQTAAIGGTGMQIVRRLD
jgi:hypothetical protein